MALRKITPFTCQEYCRQLGTMITELRNALLIHEQSGWLTVLRRYRFAAMGCAEGEEARLRFHGELRSADNMNARLEVSKEIMSWGRMREIGNPLAQSMHSTLGVLDDEDNLSPDEIEGRRIASLSKVYEMWNPFKWIIYDSYCVRGLQWLVSQVWRIGFQGQNERLLKFPLPPGRTSKPIDDFPRTSTALQLALGFVYSSWLARAIAEELNKTTSIDFVWHTYHVEMVLFQLGHEI